MLKTGSCFALLRKSSSISLYRSLETAAYDRKRICVVGSGPGGFYTAQRLLENKSIEVDIFEKLPFPFGLIRYGVAPDHPEIKNVMIPYTRVGQNDRVRFYGNVNVGQDLRVADLLQSYHAVVLAYGTTQDKRLGINGENSKNVLGARNVVAWYTGHPDFVNEKIDLDTDVAAVIGNGNVAVDVARILLQDLEKLKVSDISEHAYEALKRSRIERVVLVGRRGPFQAAFSIGEFRELGTIKDCQLRLDPNVGKIIEVGETLKLERPKSGIFKLMKQFYDEQNSSPKKAKSIELQFLRTPKEIIPDKNGRIEKIVFGMNEIEEKDYYEQQYLVDLVPTGKEDVLNCGLLIRSIGYQTASIDPDVPVDDEENAIPNKKGRVIDKKGLYCSGWVKTGPYGVIYATLTSSYHTAASILEDMENEELNAPTKGRKEILELLKKKGVRYVTFNDWEKINKIEIARGKALGKEREKFYDLDSALKHL